MSGSQGDVLFERRGRLGAIVLNRPQAMNALTHQMVTAIARTLDEWESDDSIATVLIVGAGDRGLCAGGDIVSMYRDALAGGRETEQFWRDEYTLNARIARYAKPYVALMDGVVLGGGIGVSAHGSDRIVTERTRFGMPEVGIGFAPDVGGSYLLARAPGETGTHLAMSGGMGSGADAVALGFADHYVESESLERLAERLEKTVVSDAIAEFAKPAPRSKLLSQREWIDHCYEGDDAVRIVERLQAAGPEAQAAASAILTKSPTSVTIALQSVRRVRELGTQEAGTLEAGTLEETLNQEYRVSVRFIEGPEIVEGIRAQVIDKDRNPRWNPSTLAEVSPALVNNYFSSLGERELGLHFAGPAA